MGPLAAPTRFCQERCSSSSVPWPSTRRGVAVGVHRSRRRPHWAGAPSNSTGCEDGLLSCSSQSFWTGHQQGEARGLGYGDHRTAGFPQTGWEDSHALARALFLSKEQEQQSQDATSLLLQAIGRCRTDSPLGHLSNSSVNATDDNPASTASSYASRSDVTAAAALLPSLTWQWLSAADLDGWVDRGVAHLLRETLLIQKAAGDVSASISELVGWCLDNCSPAAAALATLWGQQQGQVLAPRTRSFYGLLQQRLGPLEQQGQQQGQQAYSGPQVAAHAGASRGLTPALVFCSSVARTALSTSPRGRSSPSQSSADGEEEEEDGSDSSSTSSNAVGNGSSSADDVILLGELPAAAQAQVAEALLDEPLSAAGRAGRKHASGGTNGSANGAAKAGAGKGSSGSNGSSSSGNGIGDESHLQSAAQAAPVNGSSSADHTRISATAAAAAESQVGLVAALPAPASPRPAASLLQRPSRSTAPPTQPELGEVDANDDGSGSSSSYTSVAGAGILQPQPQWQQEASGAAASAVASSLMGAAGSRGFLESLSDDDDDARRAAALLSSDINFLLAARNDGASVPRRAYVPVRLVATGRFPIRDLAGRPQREGLAVPGTGPIVISNDPRVFAGTEGLLSDFVNPAGDKLAIRLEYIVDRSFAYGEVTLQLFNISRVTRKRTENCQMLVNGKPVNVGDPGVALAPGDEVRFGRSAAFAFRVEALAEPPSAVEQALQRLCRSRRERARASDSGGASLDVEAPASASASIEEEAGPGPGPTEAAAPPVVDMAELSNLSRRDPARAESLLRRMAAASPGDAAIWLIWAQMAARSEGPGGQAKARLLFRAAVDAARRMEVLPPPPMALQVAARRATGSARVYGSRRKRAAAAAAAAAAEEAADLYGGDTDISATGGPASPSLQPYSSGALRPRHNWLLVQALGNWGKHEWRLRMYGSARHLFRAAADEAARHPGGLAAGGGAAVMHYWSTRELEALNVRNARIVAAEALRKCPADVALYVLAASVELEGGNLELAKTYCARGYALDRTDKQLFLVWPRVEAQLGDRVKARLLYERALDAHPLNTKILNLYARFEAEEGSYREAAEMYDRALRIDSLSPGPSVHNRADWASMEADLGNTGMARQLLEEGLDVHPHSTVMLVTLAKVERLDGRYHEALMLVRRAQSLAGAFNAAVMNERAQVLRALGEREMAANLSRHVSAVKELNRMKQQGYWGSEAWRAFIEGTRSNEQRAVVAAARERRLELGWAPATRGAKPAPQPGVEAGDGRRAATPEAQQYMQLQALRNQRVEARKLEMQRAARIRAEEAAAGGGGGEDTDYIDEDEYDEDEYEDDRYEDLLRGGGGGGSRPEAASALQPQLKQAAAPAPLARRRLGPMPGGAGSSADEDTFDPAEYYDEPESMGVPMLDSVRRPTPGDDEDA